MGDLELLLKEVNFCGKLERLVSSEGCRSDLRHSTKILESLHYDEYIKELLEDYFIEHRLESETDILYYLKYLKL